MTPSWTVNLLISLILPLATGYQLLRFILRQNAINIIPAGALAYGLGLGILSQWMLFLGIAEIPYTLGIIAIPLLLITLLLGWRSRERSKRPLVSNRIQLFSSDNNRFFLTRGPAHRIFCLMAMLYILYGLYFMGLLTFKWVKNSVYPTLTAL